MLSPGPRQASSSIGRGQLSHKGGQRIVRHAGGTVLRKPIAAAIYAWRLPGAAAKRNRIHFGHFAELAACLYRSEK